MGMDVPPGCGTAPTVSLQYLKNTAALAGRSRPERVPHAHAGMLVRDEHRGDGAAERDGPDVLAGRPRAVRGSRAARDPGHCFHRDGAAVFAAALRFPAV